LYVYLYVPLSTTDNKTRTAIPRPVALPKQSLKQVRQYASIPSGQAAPEAGPNYAMWMVLAALGALGVSGYVYLKPVREAAQVASSTVNAVKGQTDGLVSLLFTCDLPC
jgi:hypothetical protein